MASINGWTMKGIKSFRGMEFDGVQGNLYYNGKKVGTYDDYGDGGSAIITLNNQEYRSILKDAIKSYYEKHPLELKCDLGEITPDEELFIGDALLGLIRNEKTYKSMADKGYPILIVYYEFPGAVLERSVSFKTEAGADRFISNLMQTHSSAVFTKYLSLNDFIL